MFFETLFVMEILPIMMQEVLKFAETLLMG